MENQTAEVLVLGRRAGRVTRHAVPAADLVCAVVHSWTWSGPGRRSASNVAAIPSKPLPLQRTAKVIRPDAP